MIYIRLMMRVKQSNKGNLMILDRKVMSKGGLKMIHSSLLKKINLHRNISLLKKNNKIKK